MIAALSNTTHISFLRISTSFLRDHSKPKAAGVKSNYCGEDAECRVRLYFCGHAHERSRSHREAQHAKLRPSTQQRDIVSYQSTLSGESRSSSPGKSNVRNAHLLTSFSQSLKARYEIAQRFCLTFLLHLPIVCWFVLVRSSPRCCF